MDAQRNPLVSPVTAEAASQVAWSRKASGLFLKRLSKVHRGLVVHQIHPFTKFT